MAHYSVATTKDQLSRLIDKALAGEEVIITRHGKPTVAFSVVEKRPVSTKTRKEWLAWLEERRKDLPTLGISSVALVRTMRDEKEE